MPQQNWLSLIRLSPNLTSHCAEWVIAMLQVLPATQIEKGTTMSGTHGSYGSLIVCGNYEGDLEAIAEALNGFVFDQDDDPDERFIVLDGRIRTNHFKADNATAAHPLRVCYKSEDGRKLPANKYRELPNENIDDWDFGYEEVSLAELSKTIAPLLKQGTCSWFRSGTTCPSMSTSKHLRSIPMAGCNDKAICSRVVHVTSGTRSQKRHSSHRNCRLSSCACSKGRLSRKAVLAPPAIAGREQENETFGRRRPTDSKSQRLGQRKRLCRRWQ
jgi:hypothetical protein